MPKPAVEVEGLKELRREIRRIADHDLKAELVDANKDIAREIVAKALPNVPVDTGRLKASVRALGNFSGAVGKAGGARVPYAPPIHWGWPRRGIPARPFLRDAANTVERGVTDEYFRRIDDLLDRVRAR